MREQWFIYLIASRADASITTDEVGPFATEELAKKLHAEFNTGISWGSVTTFGPYRKSNENTPRDKSEKK